MRESDHLQQDMEFQLSLLRLMTVPHRGGAPETGSELDGEKQLERLFQLTDSGFGG